jgi:hypothetical protein
MRLWPALLLAPLFAVGTGSFFCAVIAAQGIAVFLIPPCMR